MFEIVENERISVLNESASPLSLSSHIALAVNELHKSDIILLANAVIIFTECRRNVDNAGAVLGGYIIIANHNESLFSGLLDDCISKWIKRLIYAAFKVLAFKLIKNFAFTINAIKDRINESFS